MVTHVPFTNFTIRIANLKEPIAISHWTSFFSEDFNDVKVFFRGYSEFQDSKLEMFKIEFNAPIIFDGINQFSTVPFSASLLSSDTVFYLLLEFGKDHRFGSAASMFLKGSPEVFNQLGGGRFISIPNNLFVSFEEDEFEKYFLMVTNQRRLIEIDEPFVSARQVLNQKCEDDLEIHSIDKRTFWFKVSKENSQLRIHPREANLSIAEFEDAFEAIKQKLTSLEGSNRYSSIPDGHLLVRTVFPDDDPWEVYTEILSEGFSLNEIRLCVQAVKKQFSDFYKSL